MTLAQILASLKAILQADAAKAVLPALANYFTALANNPSALGVVGANAQLVGALTAALPTIEQDLLHQLAADMITAANNAMIAKTA